MENDKSYPVSFDERWQRDVTDISNDILKLWHRYGGPAGPEADERLRQIVYAVRNAEGQVVGVSTAYKAFVKQLGHHFFAIRLLLADAYRVPGLTSKLLVMTRDFLESIHSQDTADPAIGIITLVENPRLKQYRNEAVWPASGMVYIGKSPKGHHLRVYYFRGARV
jgi:hypothetical protein